MTVKEILAVKGRVLARRQKVSICFDSEVPPQPLSEHRTCTATGSRVPLYLPLRPVQLQLSPQSLDGFPQPPHLFL